MRRSNHYVVVLLIFIFSCIRADMLDEGIFLSPGVKLGYQFGQSRSMVVGFELSAGGFTGPFMAGGVLGTQYHLNTKTFKNYMEVEAGSIFGGISYGAEFAKEYQSLRFRVFAGMYGYLSYCFSSNVKLHELSVVGKSPFVLAGN